MESFKYGKGLNIFYLVGLTTIALGGVWILAKLPGSYILLRAAFLLSILFIFTLALKGLWRIFDRIILSDDSIIRHSLLQKIEIPWNQVMKVELYSSAFEDVGVKIISGDGKNCGNKKSSRFLGAL